MQTWLKSSKPVFLFFLLLGFLFLTKPVYAVSVEHAPSSYEVIDDGWLQPDGVYELGYSAMDTSDLTQTVNFSGFNFDIPLTATVDAVFIHFVSYVSFASFMTSISGSATLTFGLKGGSVEARNFLAYVDGTGYFDILVYDNIYNSFDHNVTSVFGNVDDLNNLEISVTANLDPYFFYVSIDYLTVIVAYSLSGSSGLSFSSGVMVVGVIGALGCIVAFAVGMTVKKR